MTNEWMKVYFDLNSGRFNVHFADDAPDQWIDRYQVLTSLIRKNQYIEAEKSEIGVHRNVPYDCTISVSEEIRTTVPVLAAGAILQAIRSWMLEQLKKKAPTRRQDNERQAESHGPVQSGSDAGDKVPEREGFEELRRSSHAVDDTDWEAEADKDEFVLEGERDSVPVPEGGSAEGTIQDKGERGD